MMYTQQQQVVYAADPGQVIYVDQNGQRVEQQMVYNTVPQQQTVIAADAGQVIYVDQNGQQVDQNGQQVVEQVPAEPQQQQQQQIVYEVPQQQVLLQQQPQVIQYVQQSSPKTFSISREQFAQLAQGGSLSQEEINAMVSG